MQAKRSSNEMESALDLARRPAIVSGSRNCPTSSCSSSRSNAGYGYGNGKTQPPPNSLEGILKAMNTQNGGRIQKPSPSPGALRLMKEHQQRTNGRNHMMHGRPHHMNLVANRVMSGYPEPFMLDVVNINSSNTVHVPPGEVRIRTKILKKELPPSTVVINSVYHSDSTQANNGVRVHSKLNTFQKPIQKPVVKDFNNFDSSSMGNCRDNGLPLSSYCNDNTTEYQNGRRRNNFPMKKKVGGPITGSWKEINVSRNELDDDLDAYMANASGGLSKKVKLGWCEKARSDDTATNGDGEDNPAIEID